MTTIDEELSQSRARVVIPGICTLAFSAVGIHKGLDQGGQLVLDADGKPVLADTSPSLRWVGNGRVVLDNKGNVIKAYFRIGIIGNEQNNCSSPDCA